ncbi:MAG: hypothetical protein ACKN9T_08135 [Candidatus Methylumidiphilus sp.]
MNNSTSLTNDGLNKVKPNTAIPIKIFSLVGCASRTLTDVYYCADIGLAGIDSGISKSAGQLISVNGARCAPYGARQSE